MLRRLAWLITIVVLVAAVIGAGAAMRMYARADEVYRGYDEPEVFVEIAPGDSTRTIAGRLVETGVVRDEWTFRLALWRTGHDRRLQAGEYRFDRPMSAVQVVDKIARGQVHLRPITFPEGLTIEEMAVIFETSGFGLADAFRKAARRVELVAELDAEATDLEGYLFPETYSLPRSTTAEDLVEHMVQQFREAFDDQLRGEAAARQMRVRDVVTLASIIQKETGQPDERALVSAVYNNRLRLGMPLQCDPTIIYALQRAGLYTGNLTREHLEFDSPYNTYRHAGLPPGPIAAPGRAWLEAALRPADVRYLYFVSRNDGSHEFASSLAEHNRNVRKYQVQYFRERRARNQALGGRR